MKRFLKMFFAAVLIAAISLLGVSVPASAWDGAATECSSTPLGFLDAADTVRNQYPSGWVGTNNPRNPDYTGMFGKTTSGKMFIAWNVNASNVAYGYPALTFYTDAGAKYHWFFSSTNLVILNDNGTYNTGNIGGGIDNSDIDCVATVRGNVSYDSSWADSHFSTSLSTALTTYDGSVDCGGATPVYLFIHQDDMSHTVQLTQTSSYTATWSYGLSSSGYSVVVGCDSTVVTSFGSVYSSTSSNDWICDIYSSPRYCVLG